MDKITTTESAIQIVMREIAPALKRAGNWLGRAIEYGIDEFVDFLTSKKN